MYRSSHWRREVDRSMFFGTSKSAASFCLALRLPLRNNAQGPQSNATGGYIVFMYIPAIMPFLDIRAGPSAPMADDP